MALLLACVCLALFAALATTVAVREGAPLPGDRAVHAWSLAHRPPVAEALAHGVTVTGGGVWPYLIAVAAGLIAGRSPRERLWSVAVAVGVLLAGQSIRSGLMELLARARPAPADWATAASGYAFPSGHATTSALAAGLLAWAVLRRTAPAQARTVCAVAACWAVAVGLSRVYLGVHWPSDVLGGWLLAAAWLSLCAHVAARRLPGLTTRTPQEPGEEDPPRRGRSRPG
ncbi:phosphatase PAP2 family protein [Streptomyces sp. B21-108]|uniref:phosphatase PAP2 family protein n=1 Tax=Streptomyces sp. B21-108 TaxID=3039419 RepID=UPI002FEFD37E